MKNSKLRNKITGTSKKILSPKQQSISFCMTIKNRSVFKLNGKLHKLFPRCIEQLLKIIKKNDEIIITDWKSTDYEVMKHFSNVIKIKYINKDGFSRGHGLNQCANLAKKDILFFMDSDLLISKRFTDSIRYMSNSRSYFPIVNRTNLYNAKKKSARLSYGTCVIHKSNFTKSSKWPEFYKWGNEDIMFCESIKNDLNLKIIRHNTDIDHIWHPPSDFNTEWVNNFTR